MSERSALQEHFLSFITVQGLKPQLITCFNPPLPAAAYARGMWRVRQSPQSSAHLKVKYYVQARSGWNLRGQCGEQHSQLILLHCFLNSAVYDTYDSNSVTWKLILNLKCIWLWTQLKAIPTFVLNNSAGAGSGGHRDFRTMSKEQNDDDKEKYFHWFLWVWQWHLAVAEYQLENSHVSHRGNNSYLQVFWIYKEQSEDKRLQPVV